jgi:hypothetical protein
VFRPSLLVLAIVVTSCQTAATQASFRPGRVEALVPAVPSAPLVDAASREVDRWVAICRGDPLDFYDNREYCLRIGPWEGYRP